MTLTATPPDAALPITAVAPPRPDIHGAPLTLTAALVAMNSYPASRAARSRVVLEAASERPRIARLVDLVESDVALCCAVLRDGVRVASARRLRRSGDNRRLMKPSGVPEAIRVLGVARVAAVARSVAPINLFVADDRGIDHEQFRRHALSVRRATRYLIGALPTADCDLDTACAAALLHDIGKLVLVRVHSDYPALLKRTSRLVDESAGQERRAYHADHALLGGTLLRRWEMPEAMCAGVEEHHEPLSQLGHVLHLADLLAHYEHGVGNVEAFRSAARPLGVSDKALSDIIFDISVSGEASPHASGIARATEPCPLAKRELGCLGLLGQGKTYKEIASHLGLSTSTVRTHLHNTYRKLGVVDRAQAVLYAADRGWL